MYPQGPSGSFQQQHITRKPSISYSQEGSR